MKRGRRMKKSWVKWLSIPLIASIILTGCTSNGDTAEVSSNATAASGKPTTWIADRTVKSLLFIDSDDISKEINPEVMQKLKEMTGITLEFEGVSADHAIDGLIAGLASNDLPDVFSFYLDNIGRPEMPVILKAAKEGLLTDLTPLMKNTKIYSKYLQDNYLPTDTKNGIMFRPEFNGSAYIMHMNINRESGYETRQYVGGPYIRKDIVEALKIDPKSITTSQKLYDLAKQIKAGNFKDNNGKEITPIGPRYWGGREVGELYFDQIWGTQSQPFNKNSDGKIVHESQTDYPLKRVEYAQKLINEKLMSPEFYTMEENRATEGAQNGSFGIIADMHNYLDFNSDGHYVPLGPLDSTMGPYKKGVSFKSGNQAWAIPATTKNPEEIMKLADFLASREGKLLWQYGIEGRDYTLDAKGNPIVKKEVIDLKNKDPKAAEKLGFDGVRSGWGSFLGSTDLDRTADFGESDYGTAVDTSTYAEAIKIAKDWGYDEKKKNGVVLDGYSPLAFLGEFSKGKELKVALSNYEDSIKSAIYAKSLAQSKKILDSAAAQLKAAGLEQFNELLDKKDKDPNTKVILGY
jgi:putative aldouronate transport system substrate-binding protein